MTVSSAHRTSARTRWNNGLTEDEFNLIPHSVASTNIENTQVILMEDCKYYFLVLLYKNEFKIWSLDISLNPNIQAV